MEKQTKTTYTTHEEEIDGGALGSVGKALIGEKAKKTRTVVDEHKETTQEKRINVVVQLLNVETGSITASSRLDIPKWSEFSKYAEDKKVLFKLTSAKNPLSFNSFLELLLKQYIEKCGGVIEGNDGKKLEDQDPSNNKKKKCC